jgi:ubiquinone/menaquinone biosynthesis C-methylase UbiE
MSQPHQDFTNVDGTADPHSHVNYLDAMSALEQTRAIKRRSFAMLEARLDAHILDVGCGTGDDVRTLAQTVGSKGRVVGVDSSETLIAEARKRAEGTNLPVEFCVGSIYQLDFADSIFDACRAERVFMHLDDPRRALAEMMRVVKQQGIVTVFDPDWETLIVDASNREVTRKILNYGCDHGANGWIGRQLVGLFRELGLKDIAVNPETFVTMDFALANQAFAFQRDVEGATQAGMISADEAASWLADQEQRAQEERFFTAVMSFGVSGKKP